MNKKLLMHWTSKYCFLPYFARLYCPSQVRPAEDMVTSYNYTLQNRRAYSRTTLSMLGVARATCPTPKQVDGAVTPLLQDEEQFSSPIFELSRPRFWSRTPPSPSSHDMSFQSTAFGGPRQLNIGPVYYSTMTPTSSFVMSSTVFTQAGCSS